MREAIDLRNGPLEYEAIGILGCLRKGKCDKNIYPPVLMRELNPKKSRSGYRKTPYIYKLKVNNDNYGPRSD